MPQQPEVVPHTPQFPHIQPKWRALSYRDSGLLLEHYCKYFEQKGKKLKWEQRCRGTQGAPLEKITEIQIHESS